MTALCQESPSAVARRRMLSRPYEPLFLADWDRALMVHYAVAPEALQRVVPFPLDHRDGEAFVSLVAFTMRGMRPRIGGKIARWLLGPIATHPFLNVRAYVRHEGEPGICFLAEWLSNRLSVALGPRFFGLPYRLGQLEYHHPVIPPRSAGEISAALRGRVTGSPHGTFAYAGRLASDPEPCACETGSLSEWLMERYTAFTCVNGRARFFRVWHRPWKQIPAEVEVQETSLLENAWPFFRGARFVGANYSPELKDVWMGWPHRL